MADEGRVSSPHDGPMTEKAVHERNFALSDQSGRSSSPAEREDESIHRRYETTPARTLPHNAPSVRP